MKIAYIIYPDSVISGRSNGIRAQAKTWKKGLIDYFGHDVTEINVWRNYNLKDFDLLHIFGNGLWLLTFVKSLHKINKNIIISPIIDTIQPPFLYKLSSYFGFSRLRLFSPTYSLRKTLPYVKGVFVRSDYERYYLEHSLNCNINKIHKVMLSCQYDYDDSFEYTKENFCLHISSLFQDRKNVIRLIRASKKYNFKLVLAGNKGTKDQFKKISKEINGSKNISVLGFISEDEMIELYKKAKVFALPSISEGVGLVALNAAYFNCEIVLTNVGAPKEYYSNLATLVNPHSIDDIGNAVVEILNGNTIRQPELRKHIITNFSNSKITSIICHKYEKLLRS